jgi:hypothetical protein
MEEVLSHILVKVVVLMNNKLNEPDKKQEVHLALFQMFSTKASGLTVSQHIFFSGTGSCVEMR